MKTPRLPAENFTYRVGRTDDHPGWDLTASVCRHPKTGHIKEIVFVGCGKAGSHISLAFQDAGIGLSRILDKRDPETGERLE